MAVSFPSIPGALEHHVASWRTELDQPLATPSSRKPSLTPTSHPGALPGTPSLRAVLALRGALSAGTQQPSLSRGAGRDLGGALTAATCVRARGARPQLLLQVDSSYSPPPPSLLPCPVPQPDQLPHVIFSSVGASGPAPRPRPHPAAVRQRSRAIGLRKGLAWSDLCPAPVRRLHPCTASLEGSLCQGGPCVSPGAPSVRRCPSAWSAPRPPPPALWALHRLLLSSCTVPTPCPPGHLPHHTHHLPLGLPAHLPPPARLRAPQGQQQALMPFGGSVCPSVQTKGGLGG